MKKVLISAIAGLMAAATLTSCGGTEIIHERDVYSVNFTVNRADWQVSTPDKTDLNAIGSYFVYEFPLPEITDWQYNNGIITCYLRYVDDEAITVQTPMPYTCYKAYDNIDGSRYFYELGYSFDISLDRQTILFKIYVSNFNTELSREFIPDETSVFQLVVMY